MDGSHQMQQQQPSRKTTILNRLKQKHKNEQQHTPKPVDPPQQTINVDQLAKEKVDEIDEVLSKSSSLKQDALNSWFSTLKQIITAANLHRTIDGNNKDDLDQSNKQETGDCIYADYVDDNEQFNASVDLSEQFATNSVKWTIRVQAFKIVHRLVQLLCNSSKKTSPLLVKLLPDLVRLAFVAATSPYDELKMQGFEMFKFLIERFATMEEKEFPGHSILEQYKTQFLSAVKPAFNMDAPPYTTAIASQICSLWICHGLEKEFSDVKRTYQLMLLSIDKLNNQGINQYSKLYNESELEQERVDILGAWAQLDIASLEDKISNNRSRIFRLTDVESANLRSLIEPKVHCLVDKWWEALKDYALLIMPSPKFIGSIHDNEHVYTREVALKLFEPIWPKLVLAQTYNLVLRHDQPGQVEMKYVQFLCGIILRELSRFVLANKIFNHNNPLGDSTILALKSLHSLISSPKVPAIFQEDLVITREFYSVLYNMAICPISDQSIILLLRDILDKLLTFAFSKVLHEESCVHFTIAKLISLLMNTMKDLEIACKQKSSDLESLKKHLEIRVRILVSVMRSSPVSALDEAPLQEALTAVFQELLKFDHDKALNLNLVDRLQQLPSNLPCKSVIQEHQSPAEKATKEIELKSERKKITVQKPNSIKPQAAKITLRTDFSNFYQENKSSS
jgi:hypothetical protein